jgi:hypothetical protein
MKTRKFLGAAAGVPAFLFMCVMTAAAVDIGGAPELRQPAPGSAVPAGQDLEVVFELPFTDAQTCNLWTLDISVRRQGDDQTERYLATAEWSPGRRATAGESSDTAPACLGTKRIRLAPGQWSIRATATHSLGYGRSFSPWASFSVQ